MRVLKWLERLGIRPERTEPAAHLEAVDLGSRSAAMCVHARVVGGFEEALAVGEDRFFVVVAEEAA